MKCIKSTITMASIVAVGVLSTTRSANAQWSDCNSGSNYNGSCFYGSTNAGYATVEAYSDGNSSGSNGYAIYGSDLNNGVGVFGASDSGYGGSFSSTSSHAIYATNGSDYATIYGVNNTSTGTAVRGDFNPSSGGDGYAIYGSNPSTVSGAWAGYFNGQVEVTSGYSYYYNGTATCVGGHCSSDQRLKRDIAPLSGALDTLLRLNGVNFKWINPAEHGNRADTQTGFIAQEVEKVFPTWVDEDKNGMKGVVLPPMELAALQVEAFRTLKMQNDSLAEQVKELQSGRQMRVSGINLNGVGFGVGGIAIAMAVFLGLRSKRDEVKV